MTKSVFGLAWKPTGEIDNPVALVGVNFATDITWTIVPFGDYTGGQTVHAKYVTVDNSSNAASVAVTVGLIPYTVNQLSRTTIPIPDDTPSLSIVGSTGLLNVVFWVKRPDTSADGPNTYLITQAASVTSAALNSSAMNPIINSQFTVWPQGTSVAISGAGTATYGPEGWEGSRNGGTGAVTLSRQTGPSGGAFAAQVQRTAADAAVGTIFFGTQLTSNDSVFAQGGSYALGIDAAALANFSAAGSTLNITVYAGAGTDQNIFSGFTGQTAVGTLNATLTTAFQRFTVPCAFPANTSQIGILLQYTPTGVAGAADGFKVSRAQFDQGTTANAYRPVPDALETARCNSFFERITNDFLVANAGLVSGVTDGGTSFFGVLAHDRKRALPSLSVSAVADYSVLVTPGLTTIAPTSFSGRASKSASELVFSAAPGVMSQGGAEVVFKVAGTGYLEINARL